MQRVVVLFFFIFLLGCLSQQNEVSSSPEPSGSSLDAGSISPISDRADGSEECPFGKINDSYPGSCGRYVDLDNDGICDLSE